ncbi:MAG: T9SS type A sorting domain-containing protein [Ignavibacteriales bacterium]|nr:MAG: T9SS type A sorting domain-containing protein [Ignavibacteriales bacterium]
MKKLVLFLFLTAGMLQAQFVDWQWLHPKPHGNHLNDAVILSGGKILTFSDAGIVSISTDGGSSWTLLRPDTVAGNRSIYEADFVNDNVGYAVGTAGLAMKTTDGGATWAQLTTNLTSNIWYVDFVNENLGYIGGSSGKLLKTTDGGATWSEQVIGGTTSVLVYKIHALNADTVYAGTGSATPGRLIRTTDGGATWSAVSGYTATGTVRAIYFVNPQIGFVGDALYAINKTTDGGATWSPVDYGTGTFYEIKFATDSLGFAAGADGNVYVTTDQGTVWTPSFIGAAPTSNVYGLALGGNLAAGPKSAVSVLAVCEAGLAVLSNNSGATWNILGTSLNREELREIAFVNDQFGFATGGSGTAGDSLGVVFVTNDGGMNWTQLPFNPKFRVYSGNFLNTQTGYVSTRGNSGVFKTTDGGTTWTQQTLPITSTTTVINTTQFWDEMTGYVATSGGDILKTTDGGATWTALPDPHGTTAIYDIELFSASDLIATGTSGKTYRSTDGGATWVNLNPTTTTLYAMDFPSPQFGYLVGSSGRIVMTSNGGTTWTTQTSNSTATLYTVKFFNDSVGFVLGSVGEVLFTSDAGTTWIPYTQAPSNATFYSADIRNGGLYAVGSRANIIKGLFSGNIPVELTSFTASAADGKVILDWTTATETNNARFEIQRRSGNEEWSVIGSVRGSGTTVSAKAYRFTDNSAVNGIYSYRLKQIDFDGSYEFSQVIEVNVGMPSEFALYQNYPNPFNPSTMISFALPQSDNISLKVYDILGNEVAVLLSGKLDAGNHTVEFNAAGLSSGIYLYKLQNSAGNALYGKMNLMK